MRRGEVATAALLVGWAFAPVAVLLGRLDDGEALTGATGPFAGDQLQYGAWMRSAADNGGLAGNLFDLGESGAVFAHPMASMSGALLALGAAVPVALLAWAPVAVAVLAVGVWRFSARHLDGPRWVVPVAAVLASWSATPVPWLHELLGAPGDDRRFGSELVGQATPAAELWGYFPTVAAVGLVPLCLLGAEALLERRGNRRTMAGVAAGCALAGWLHPWEGALLLVVLGLAGASLGRAAVRPLLVPMAAGLVPLGYYAALPLISDDWEVARAAEASGPRPLLGAAIALAPLLGLAAFGVGRVHRGLGAGPRLLLAWPVAAVALYLTVPAFPLHALATVSIPLAVLVVRGIRHSPVVAAVATVALVVPGQVDLARFELDLLRADVQPHILGADERDALDFLDDSPHPGGVLTTFRLGTAVPAFTGRAAWVGHPYWTPDYVARGLAAAAVLHGTASAAETQAVATSGATFLLAGCGEDGPLPPVVADRVMEVRRFGCVAVHRLGP